MLGSFFIIPLIPAPKTTLKICLLEESSKLYFLEILRIANSLTPVAATPEPFGLPANCEAISPIAACKATFCAEPSFQWYLSLNRCTSSKAFFANKRASSWRSSIFFLSKILPN